MSEPLLLCLPVSVWKTQECRHSKTQECHSKTLSSLRTTGSACDKAGPGRVWSHSQQRKEAGPAERHPKLGCEGLTSVIQMVCGTEALCYRWKAGK